jgi:hypothetical protein
MEALKAQYVHPLWDKTGEAARKAGGHGGMDYVMDLRFCHCLKNGLPWTSTCMTPRCGAPWWSSASGRVSGGSAVEVLTSRAAAGVFRAVGIVTL